MRYIISGICVLAIILTFVFVGLKVPQETTNQEYLRIHIRANSNSQEDQDIKYMVRDAVVEALIPILSEVESKDEAEMVMKQNFSYIESISNQVLSQNGFSYKSKARISNEYFPTRVYENLTLENGYYDALILDLGEGEGNNWWCVVYPAFCFLKSKKTSNNVYISKIWEIINSVKQK